MINHMEKNILKREYMYIKWNISLSFSHTQYTYTHWPAEWINITHLWMKSNNNRYEWGQSSGYDWISVQEIRKLYWGPTLPFISKHYHNQENSLRLFWEAMEDTVLWFIQHGFQPYSPLPFLLKKIDFPAFLRARGHCTTEFWPLKQKHHVASATSSLSVFFCLLCWLDA